MNFLGFGTLEFADSWWFAALALLPLFAWLRGRVGHAPSVAFPTAGPLVDIGRSRRNSRGAILGSLLAASAICWIIALARPQLVRSETITKSSGVDIMLALDVSRSMLAEDFTIGGQRANRLDAVKQVTDKFIAGRSADRIGIIAFAGRPYLVSPLTLDHSWLKTNLERIRIGLVEDGTAIGSAIGAAAKRLKDSKSKTRIIVLLTDGDNNAGPVSPETAAEAAAAIGLKIYTIGAGSFGPAPFPVVDPFGRTTYRRLLMEFDEGTLKRIAEKATGKYFRASNTESLQQVFQEIDRLEKTEISVSNYREEQELYPWPLAIGTGLLALQVVMANTLYRKTP